MSREERAQIRRVESESRWAVALSALALIISVTVLVVGFF